MTDRNLEVPGGRAISVKAPDGSRFIVCAGANGYAYASSAAWVDALKVPSFRRPNFEAGLVGYAGRHARGRLLAARFNGADVVAWQVVAEALDHVHAKYLQKVNLPRPVNAPETPDQWAQLVAFVTRISDMKWWGYDLQSNAMAQVISGGLAAPTATPAGSAMDVVRAIAASVVDHEDRLVRVEARGLRDPEQPVTIAEAIAEIGLDAAEMTRGRLNLEQDAGMKLRAAGTSAAGQKVFRRLSGSAVDVQVNRWRREDAYRVLGDCKDASFGHLLAGGSRGQ